MKGLVHTNRSASYTLVPELHGSADNNTTANPWYARIPAWEHSDPHTLSSGHIPCLKALERLFFPFTDCALIQFQRQCFHFLEILYALFHDFLPSYFISIPKGEAYLGAKLILIPPATPEPVLIDEGMVNSLLNGRFVCEAFPAYKMAFLDEDHAVLQPHLDGQEQHKAELSRVLARINHSASALSEKSQLRNQCYAPSKKEAPALSDG